MIPSAIDHVVLPVRSLDAAAPYEQLGLRLTPPASHPGLGTENRVFFTGATADTHFYVELLGVRDQGEAEAAGQAKRGWLLDALRAETPGMARIALTCDDIEGAQGRLAAAGIEAQPYQAFRADGSLIADVLPLAVEAVAGANLALIRDPRERGTMVANRVTQGMLEHDFPLKRIDHLAGFVSDIEAATRFWVDVLGVPVFGEISTPAIVIRQMRMGDAIFEVLAATGPDSPLASRPPGLASMCAFEVPDLQAAVELARARGFTAPDPAFGVLPRARTSTIPATELSGMGLQLLEYV
ncbi:MAG: VOC family protein [Tepidiformaceae bacterium]